MHPTHSFWWRPAKLLELRKQQNSWWRPAKLVSSFLSSLHRRDRNHRATASRKVFRPLTGNLFSHIRSHTLESENWSNCQACNYFQSPFSSELSGKWNTIMLLCVKVANQQKWETLTFVQPWGPTALLADDALELWELWGLTEPTTNLPASFNFAKPKYTRLLPWVRSPQNFGSYWSQFRLLWLPPGISCCQTLATSLYLYLGQWTPHNCNWRVSPTWSCELCQNWNVRVVSSLTGFI